MKNCLIFPLAFGIACLALCDSCHATAHQFSNDAKNRLYQLAMENDDFHNKTLGSTVHPCQNNPKRLDALAISSHSLQN